MKERRKAPEKYENDKIGMCTYNGTTEEHMTKNVAETMTHSQFKMVI